VQLGTKPPEFGSIEFDIDMAPVSLQAKSQRKSNLKAFVTSIVEQAGFLLSGDVKVQIEWSVHEQKRYETNASADTDNVIKPLLVSTPT